MHVVFLIRPALQATHPHKIMRLEEELHRAGHTSEAVDFADFSLHAFLTGLLVLRQGVPFAKPSLIYWAHEWADAEAFDLMQAFEDAGYPLFMSPRMPMSDKVSQADILPRAGVPVPPTWVVTSPHAVPSGASFPLILKGRFGARGEAVRWVSSVSDMAAAVQELGLAPAEPFVLQTPIPPLGEDVRAFVVGTTVVAAMVRRAPPGAFRANASLGGTCTATSLSPAEEAVVLAAHNAFHTPVSGVDFIRSATGPVVLEVNLWPGLQAIEAATGVNVAAHMVAAMQACVPAA